MFLSSRLEATSRISARGYRTRFAVLAAERVAFPVGLGWGRVVIAGQPSCCGERRDSDVASLVSVCE